MRKPGNDPRFFFAKNLKILEFFFAKPIDKLSHLWYNIYNERGSPQTMNGDSKMKNYEVIIENRKNTIWSNFLEPIRMIVAAENKKQAADFAYEIFQPEYRMSREKVKITAERFNG